VWSLSVVVRDVDLEDVGELAPAEDQQPVKAFAADAADPALHVSVRVRRAHRRVDDLISSLARSASKARGNFASRSWIKNRTRWSRSSSSIRRFRACCSIHAVSGLLVSAKYSMRRPPMERKASLQRRRSQTDGEEVAGEDRLAMGAQEAAPCLRVTPRRRRQASRDQDVANRARGDRDAQLA
jgi:hypothetical protein